MLNHHKGNFVFLPANNCTMSNHNKVTANLFLPKQSSNKDTTHNNKRAATLVN